MLYDIIGAGMPYQMASHDLKIRLQEVEKADHDSYWVQNGLFNRNEPDQISKCCWVMLCCLCCRDCCFNSKLEDTRVILKNLRPQILNDKDKEILPLYARAMENLYKKFFTHLINENQSSLKEVYSVARSKRTTPFYAPSPFSKPMLSIPEKRTLVPSTLDVDGCEGDLAFAGKRNRNVMLKKIRIITPKAVVASSTLTTTTTGSSVPSQANTKLMLDSKSSKS